MTKWYRETIVPGQTDVRVNLMPETREMHPGEMGSAGDDPEHWRGMNILLEGKAPVWAYARLAYLAVRVNATCVRVFQPQEKEKHPLGIPVYPINGNAGEGADWVRLRTEGCGRHVEATLQDAPFGHAGWAVDDVLSAIPEYPAGCASIILGGKGAAWMYAALAAQAARKGVQTLHCDIPRLGGRVSIGSLNPGQIERIEIQEQPPGMVLGILGDPNSGKSVFSKVLSLLLRQVWPDTWMYDGDQASPTGDWFLKMMSSGKDVEARKWREEIKRDWSHEMEKQAAADLRTSVTKLQLVIADMPGGLHPRSNSTSSLPQRIPPGRELMMKEVDAFLILGKRGCPDITAAWRAELARHGLEDRVLGEIMSVDPEEKLALEFKEEGGFLIGAAQGLDRSHLYQLDDARQDPLRTLAPLIVRIQQALDRKAVERKVHGLVQRARGACSLAFLTKEGGVSYGAAVLTRDGYVFESGQYSSFNHVTNIHAECGALLQAVMAGHPDVWLLALASTTPEQVIRPCGVCRQVMLEHAQRTGVDFWVAMSSLDGETDLRRVSELIPDAWSSHRAAPSIGKATLQTGKTLRKPVVGHKPGTGDHVVFGGGRYLGLVWEPVWDADNRIWVKVKYHRVGGHWQKWPHSLTEPHAYARMVLDHDLARQRTFAPLVLLTQNDVEGCIPCETVNKLSLPKTLWQLLEESGISHERVRSSGSRSLGIANKDSDWDLIVPATPEQIRQFRIRAAAAIEEGRAGTPSCSGTWQLLDQLFPGGRQRILAERRFLETLEMESVTVVLVFVPPGGVIEQPLFPDGHGVPQRKTFAGSVRESSTAAWKSSRFILENSEGAMEVRAYLKTANLVRDGDVISVSGWHIPIGEGVDRLLFGASTSDRLCWLRAGTEV